MALATVTITPIELIVEPLGINKLWGFRAIIRVPLEHVVSADVGTADRHRSKGLRAPGLGWYNRWVGRFRTHGVWTYWCAQTGPTLEITLRDEQYGARILSVDNPRELAAEINDLGVSGT